MKYLLIVIIFVFSCVQANDTQYIYAFPFHKTYSQVTVLLREKDILYAAKRVDGKRDVVCSHVGGTCTYFSTPYGTCSATRSQHLCAAFAMCMPRLRNDTIASYQKQN